MSQRLFYPRLLLCLLVVANSGCVFLTDNKLAGVPYLRELHMAAIVGSSGFLWLTWARPWQSRAAYWVLFMGLGLPLLSALMAYLHFGQPLQYGVLEERRNVLYLLFFPALYLMVRARPTQVQLERWFLAGAFACVAVGFMYYFKLVPENADVAFNQDVKDYGNNPLRPDRYSIGISYVSVSAMMLMYRLRRAFSLVPMALLGVLAAYLWLVLQTRNIMLIWVLAALWVFRDRLGKLVWLSVAAVVAGAALYLFMPALFNDQAARLAGLIQEASEPGGVRADTTAIILRDTAANWFVGMGALSLQWQGGFSRFYSAYFYLSDVGILGVFYRFGVLTLPIVMVYFIGYWRVSRQCRFKGDLLNAFRLDMSFNALNLFFSSSLMYGGDIAGLGLAAFVYYGWAQAQGRTQQPLVPQRPPRVPAAPVASAAR